MIVNRKEFRAARKALGLSQMRLARVLGVNVRTVRRWDNGERELNELACRFVDILIRYPEVGKEMVFNYA
jgi:DNA-binding transcriptional regulator YiaG